MALDLTTLEDMIRVVREIENLPIDIFEVGTPLIKAEGVKSVSVLRALVGSEKLILADMKTADVGALEVKLAHEAGADATTVLASSDDEVIKSAMDAGIKLGTDVIIDTVGVRDVETRVGELIDLGARIVNLHIGIDVQKSKGLTAGEVAGKFSFLVKKFRIHFSISGGIKATDIYKLRRMGFKIIVVGSAITKSVNPRKAAKAFIRELHKMK